MKTNTTFRGIDHEAAAIISRAAQASGADIQNVVTMLRNGTTLKGIAVSSLYAGLQHAAKLWAGSIVLGLGDRPSLPGTPNENIRQRAKMCALEVRSWLEETRLINDVPTPLLDCNDAQKKQFETLIEGLIRIADAE